MHRGRQFSNFEHNFKEEVFWHLLSKHYYCNIRLSYKVFHISQITDNLMKKFNNQALKCICLLKKQTSRLFPSADFNIASSKTRKQGGQPWKLQTSSCTNSDRTSVSRYHLPTVYFEFRNERQNVRIDWLWQKFVYIYTWATGTWAATTDIGCVWYGYDCGVILLCDKPPEEKNLLQ